MGGRFTERLLVWAVFWFVFSFPIMSEMCQPPLIALMRDSGHVPLCRIQLVCLRLRKGNHQRSLRSQNKPPWHMARFLSSFSYKAAMLPITFVQPASQPSRQSDRWLWPQQTQKASRGWHMRLLLKGEVDGLQRGYGGCETYSHTESSTVQASRQARTGDLPWCRFRSTP